MREFKKLPLELFIGYDIEQNSRVIELDASEMVEKYPSGILQLVCKRPGEETTYIAPSFEQDGGTLRWTLTSYDVEKAGHGLAIVALVDTSEESVKVLASHKIRTGIEEGLHFRDAETVDPEDSLIARVLAAVSQAQAYAQDAKEEADRAEAALDDVEDAKDQAISDIETKGQETLDSIPADYTALSGDVSDLKSAVNDVDGGIISPEFTDGIFINYANGNEVTEGGYSATGFIEIVPGFSYALTARVTSSIVGYAFYDADHNYISGYAMTTSGTVAETFIANAPHNAKYMRFSSRKDSKATAHYKILVLSTVEEINKNKLDGSDIEQTFGQNTKNAMSQKAVTDLLNITQETKITELESYASVVDGKYCNPANGNISDVTSYKTATIVLKTALIDVVSIFDSYSNRGVLNYDSIVFFSENDTYISGYQPSLSSQSEQVEYDGHYGIYFVVPSNAKKAVVNLIKSRDSQRYSVVTYKVASIGISQVSSGSPLNGKTVVNFGDSIFGNYRDANDTTDKSISKMIEEATGATVYNAGFGGCRMATAYRYWDAFSMHSLADSIALTKTGLATAWNVQESAIAESDAEPETGTSKLLDYFPTTLAMLKEIDFSKVDYITIGYGTNDYTGNISISSFIDALKYSINKILTAYPHIRVVVISPCWRWWASNGAYSYSSDDAQSENTHGDKLTAYVTACEDVSNEYHVPFIDTYNTLGFNQFTATTYFTGTDGTHPNQYGRQLRADRIVGQMNSLY